MDGSRSLESAHVLTEVIEAKIRTVAPGADITIHAEPVEQT
jgi:divalent metal cation (Fe/Co/Zn/Cd) transporter